MLATLLVLDLGAGCAVLTTRRVELFAAAMAASGLILTVWVSVASMAPWPLTAIFSAGALAALACAWIHLARRMELPTGPFVYTAAAAIIVAQIVTIVAAQQPGAPGVAFLAGAHLALLAALLSIAWVGRVFFIALLAWAPAAIAASLWIMRFPGPEFYPGQALFALAVYLAFVVYPLVLGKRAGSSLAPYLAAVLASAIFFFQMRHTIVVTGHQNVIGLLPVAQALVLLTLLLRLVGLGPREDRILGRMALVAAAALAFVTVAIPLQLEKEWITISWALEGAALAWLYGKLPHRGLFYAANGLLVTAFFRLNPAVLISQARSTGRIWNWYMYTYLLVAAALILAGWLFAKRSKPEHPRIAALLAAASAVLLFILVNIEIADYFSTGERIAFNFSATLPQDMTYTLGWAAFAVALLAVGIVMAAQPARIASLGLLVITILKCFVHDLGRLGGLYRVMSFVGLAVCLTLVALALQKFVLAPRKEARIGGDKAAS
jgi:hypothetical protein